MVAKGLCPNASAKNRGIRHRSSAAVAIGCDFLPTDPSGAGPQWFSVQAPRAGTEKASRRVREWIQWSHMRVNKKLITLAVAAALTGCGGGSDSTTSATTVSTFTPEGHWTGFTSAGWAFNMAVLEDGDTWGLYYSGSTILGAISGKTTSTPTAFTGTGTEFMLPARSAVESKYSGTFTRKATLTLQTSGGVAVNASYAPSYDQPANLGTVAGTYSGVGQTTRTAIAAQPLTVTSTGSITGGVAGCTVTGVLLPRASGKGVFNLFIDRDGLQCATGSTGSFQGLAFYDATDRRLIAVSANAKKEDGFFYVGTRN